MRIFLAVALFFSSCATYQDKTRVARSSLKSGQIEQAIEALEVQANQVSRDQLLYLMELGTAYQLAGRYKDSNLAFLKAEKLTETQDYHSASNIALATLGSEEMIQYKGESYEKFLLNVLMSLNYLALGEIDNALVQARRINEKIQQFRQTGRPDYEQNPLAQYMAGLLWEIDGNLDNAYISYEQSYRLDPTNVFLKDDLLRISLATNRSEALNKWKKEFSTQSVPQVDRKGSELIVVVLQGWGPERGFARGDYRFPKLTPVSSETAAVRMSLPEVKGADGLDSQLLYDVEHVAIRTLELDYGWMALRKIGRFAAKEVIADQIRQKDQLLGLLASVAMHASDRGDLRHWSTLPQTLQLIRKPLKPGSYQVELKGLGRDRSPTGETKTFERVVLSPGQKKVLFWRPIK